MVAPLAISGKLCVLLNSVLPIKFLVSGAVANKAHDAINMSRIRSIILNQASTQAVLPALQHDQSVLDICSAMQHLLDISGCI